MKKIPEVAIVGRVNTGKSTLFNRIIKKPLSIVDARPGLTRDRVKKPVEWDNFTFFLTDTGGLYPPEEDLIWEKVREKIKETVENADLVILLVDASQGVTPFDEEIAEWLRSKNKDVILVANKIDKKDQDVLSFYKLGLGEPLGISAVHGRGIQELLDRIAEKLRAKGYESVRKKKEDKVRVAILGKPNVGKSSILNALCGKEITIISPIPGTTRDSVDVETDEFIFVDTAGIRRKYQDEVEYYGALRSMSSLRYSEVAILVIDASLPVTHIDKKIANLIVEEGRGLVVTLNKSDLIPKKKRAETFQYFVNELFFLDFAPKIYVSALTGEGIEFLKELVKVSRREWKRKLSRREVDDFIYEVMAKHPPTAEITFFAQVGTEPPKFLIKTKGKLKQNYIRFLERELRQRFGFQGTPIVIKNEVQNLRK